MNLVLRTVIVDRDATVRQEVQTALAATDFVRLEAEFADYDTFPAAGELPHVVMVGVDSDTPRALDLIARVARQFPGCGICAVSRSHDGQLILRAIRAGAKEFVTLPAQAGRTDHSAAAGRRPGCKARGQRRTVLHDDRGRRGGGRRRCHEPGRQPGEPFWRLRRNARSSWSIWM